MKPSINTEKLRKSGRWRADAEGYDTAFRYLSTRSYGCYDLVRGPDAPPSTSVDDAGRKLRGSLERIGQWVGTTGRLETIIEAAEPLHPSIRVMDQPYSRMFSVTSFPNALGAAVECDARARGGVPPDPLPLEYGEVFGMTFRFRTQGGMRRFFACCGEGKAITGA